MATKKADPQLALDMVMGRKGAQERMDAALAPPVMPDYTDQIIKAVMGARRPQAGRTRQASFGMPDFSFMFGGGL